MSRNDEMLTQAIIDSIITTGDMHAPTTTVAAGLAERWWTITDTAAECARLGFSVENGEVSV